MTLPDERYRAVLQAQEFLIALSDPALIKRVPKEIRQRARGILRHYPSSWDLDQASRTSPHVFQASIEDVRRMMMVYEQGKDNDKA